MFVVITFAVNENFIQKMGNAERMKRRNWKYEKKK